MHRSTYSHAVYPVAGYKFGHKASKPEKDGDKLARMRAKYEREGLRREVAAVVLVQQHGHPHILLLQLAGSGHFRLPGGKLKPGEDEAEGLRRKLVRDMSPDDAALATHWEVGECVGTWWRPNFDTVFYPYLPPHITRPKEMRRLFVVPLLDRSCFAVPRNYRLVAVPLFELYENQIRFGPVLASIPQMLCRLRLNVVGGSAAAKAAAAGAAPQQPAGAGGGGGGASAAGAAAGAPGAQQLGGGGQRMEAQAY